MLCGLSSKYFTGFRFAEKHSSMTFQSKDKLVEEKKMPVPCPVKSNISFFKRIKKTGSKSPTKTVIIPAHRFNKRGSADECMNRKSKLNNTPFVDRSLSCPTRGTESIDERLTVKSQSSIFQSPFDTKSLNDEDLFRYDINISCHKNQLEWVETLLLPILEDELQLRCYLHTRDSLPGVSTVKNIAAAVKGSRMTILCFSKDYLSSSWQNYESLIAHHVDPSGWKKRILPIMVENCTIPYKFSVYATLKWPDCNQYETVPAPVKLRRRFFICGLLNALGNPSRERAMEIYKSYCEMYVPVVSSTPDNNAEESPK